MPRDLQLVLDALLDGVVVLDREGRVERVNAEACRILGTSPESVLGLPVERLLGPAHGLAAVARRVLASGRTALESEQRVERRFAAPLVIDIAGSPFLDGSAAVEGAVLALRDRTIQSSLQEVVAEREQLAAFGHIAAGIAHEVKNPLGGIRGAAELVAMRSSDAKTREAAELVVREVDRIAQLVDDLLIFARGEKLRLESLNLHRVLDDVLDLLALDPIGRHVSVERSYDPSIPEILGDRDRLTQVFLNLGRNALQALEGRGGTLSISTRTSLEQRFTLEDGSRVPAIAIEFRDTGPGIPEEVLEDVLTPFFTTRSGGTGLGLALSRHWVARHGGTLRIESAPGQGTAVRVTLPLRRADAGAVRR